MSRSSTAYNDHVYSTSTLIIASVAAACAAAALILFTPVRWVMLTEPAINDIDAAGFQERFAANPDNFVFLDVRPAAAYTALHAEGSSNMPLHTFFDTWRTLPKDGKEIVLICSGGRASGVAYHFLQHFGFFNIARIHGGIEAWVLAGLPTNGAGTSINPAAETP